ncbi:MAG: ABC transporter permease subunit [Planctomycetes bacterium]|nr:ABC transporter permease subunit [Planctomycetota bacterium]
MNVTLAVFKRELKSYFATPIAYVFIAVFLGLAGLLTFPLSGYFERGQADLEPFFQSLPMLFLVLVPAVSMRLWSEERQSGTIELLMTLPISMGEAVMGKFLAAWAFSGIALAGTFPMWLTVNWLGDPDNGVIAAGYLVGFLMAGAFLAVGASVSALTKNQVIAFVVTVATLGLFIILSYVVAWLPDAASDTLATVSPLDHFQSIVRGVVELRDLVFFASFIALWLFVNAVVVQRRKAA